MKPTQSLPTQVDAGAAAAGEAGHKPGHSPGNVKAPGRFIGQSTAMAAIYEMIHSVARSNAPVFITGESGTGKLMCAQEIHRQSACAAGPFIELNCGALAAAYPDSDLFGHVKGAHAAAHADRRGALAAADGGTLFLDDICDLNPALQAKLLRFLQASTFQPLGAAEPRRAEVRLICASTEDPAEAVRQGRLREDLYYRLHVIPIRMPPLRARDEDVNQIAMQALLDLATEEGRRFSGLSADVRDLFRRLPWPGNVRQLLNILRQIVVIHDGETVTKAMLPAELLAEQADNFAPAIPTSVRPLMGKRLADIERLVIEATVAHHGGSVSRAARTLDVAPSTLYRKMESWAATDAQSGVR